LKAIGIDPGDVTAIIEKSVVNTLEKLQLGEAINKRMVDIEAKLSEQIKPLVDMAQQAQQVAEGQAQQVPIWAQPILTRIGQKLVGGDSSSLESLTATLKLAQSISEIMIKPYLEGQAAARREMNELIRFVSGVQKLPPGAQEGFGGGAE